MGQFNGLLSMLGKAVETLAPMVVPGAGPAIEAGKAIARAFDTVQQHNGGHVPADAAASKARFDEVMAHAERTFSRLEGN